MRALCTLLSLISLSSTLVFAQSSPRSGGRTPARPRASGPSCRVSCGSAAVIVGSENHISDDVPQFRGCLATAAVTPGTHESNDTVEEVRSLLPASFTLSSTGGRVSLVSKNFPYTWVSDSHVHFRSSQCYVSAYFPAARGAPNREEGRHLYSMYRDERGVASDHANTDWCSSIQIECRNSGAFRYGAPGHRGRDDESLKSTGAAPTAVDSGSAEPSSGSPAHD
jgi:hypothetical protein